MAAPKKVLATTSASCEGGRASGKVALTGDGGGNGRLYFHMEHPKGLGGSGEGTNPEQLFALGYSTCFNGAVLYVAAQKKIDAAKAKCKELLTGDPLDYEQLQPIKEGICGAPAPVMLRAVGTDPKVVINPPATITCPMADVLGEWLERTVQPEAKKVFGSPVVKIQNATSYSCRNRYGGATTPLSEHALANALDVSEFILANGVRITVLDNWPKLVVAETAAVRDPGGLAPGRAAMSESRWPV